MSLHVLCLLVLWYLYIQFVFGLQIIPERAEAHFINESYAKDVNINVRKLGRKGGYVVNLNFTIFYDLGKNVTMDILFFEYLHNEYRRTFVEMHFNICDMIYNDQLVGTAVRNAGFTTCPVKAGTYQMANMSIPNVENFPYVWPFERARAMGIFVNHKTGVYVANGSVYFTFKQTKRKFKP